MRIILSLVLCILSITVNAKPSIDQIVEMPVDGMIAIKDSNGQLIFASKNYRYVFKGEVFDAWSGENILTINQVKDSAHSIYLDRMDLDIEALGAVTVGSGKETVVVFTDPACPACFGLLEEIDDALLSKYTFKFLIVPALGGKSRDLAKRVACENDKSVVAKNIINKSLEKLSVPDARCDVDSYYKMLATADVLGIKEVPFLIKSNGNVLRGKPKNLAQWLSQ